jgi:HAD superfamily hydrolase (TIGR01509 family)
MRSHVVAETSLDFDVKKRLIFKGPVLFIHTMIKVVVFDLWNTIGTKGISISQTFQKKFAIDDYEGYLQDYEKSVQLNKWSSKEEMAKNFLKTFKLPETEENVASVISVYDQGIQDATFIEGMEEIVKKLSKKFPLALISNTTCFEFDFLKRKGLADNFTLEIFSFDIGRIKPDKLFFDKICEHFSVGLEECLFIDDSEYNTSTARTYGVEAIRFTNDKALKKELARFSIELA